jgi:hypothetical protein
MLPISISRIQNAKRIRLARNTTGNVGLFLRQVYFLPDWKGTKITGSSFSTS